MRTDNKMGEEVTSFVIMPVIARPSVTVHEENTYRNN